MSKIESVKNNNSLVPILFLGVLLFLRLPYLLIPDLRALSEHYGIPFYEEGTYLFTALLIWWERKRLIDFNIKIGPLLIFIIVPIFKPLFNKILVPFVPYIVKAYYSIFQIIVALILGAAFVWYLMKNKKWPCFGGMLHNLKWLLFSIVVGVVMGIGMGLINYGRNSYGLEDGSFIIFISMFVTQLSSAAILEEPLFRGFLWGYLKHSKIKEHWILILQTVLFTIGHFYYWGKYPVSLFIIVPVSALIFGLMVWRSKSIGTSLIVHSLMNSLAQYINSYNLF